MKLSLVEELRYLGRVITADCPDDKDIKKQFRRQNTVGNMLVRKFSFEPVAQKYNCSSHILAQFMDVLFRVIYT